MPSRSRGGNDITADRSEHPALTITFPDSATVLDQNEEFCFVAVDGVTEKIRFHDYATIFRIPGLYEQLFTERLQCHSPEVLVGMLRDAVGRDGVDPGSLSALDFGAGNGQVAEQLRLLGVSTVIGVDLLPEAREAALRDRPDVYDDYLAADITDLDSRQQAMLDAAGFTCLTCVAALGFDDVPPNAFAAAYDLVRPDGYVVFNLRDKFVDRPGAFSRLLERMTAEGLLDEVTRLRYPHRLSVTGEQLDYIGVVARKRGDVPPELLA